MNTSYRNKNITLSIFYVEGSFDDIIKKFTFITPNAKNLRSLVLQENMAGYPLIKVSYRIMDEVEYTIGLKKDIVMHNACLAVFEDKEILKLDDFLPFDADIDHKSCTKEILFQAKQYKPLNSLELFLEKHGILQSYYRRQVLFKIENKCEEYSRDLGDKVFSSQSESETLDINVLFNIPETHIGTVYSCKTKTKLLSITGINDQGKQIEIKM